MTSHFKFRWLAALGLAVSLLAAANPASAQTCPSAPNEGDSVALNLDAGGTNIAGCASGGNISRGVVVTNILASNKVKVELVQTGNNGTATCSGGGCTSYSSALAPSAQIGCDTTVGQCVIFIQDVYSQGTLYMSLDIAQYSTSISSIGFLTAGVTPPKPNITSLSPNSFSTGTPVVITGTNFTGAAAVNFASSPAPSFRVDSDTQITVLAPANNQFSASSKVIVVSTLGGLSNGVSYTVTGAGLVFAQPVDQPFVLNGTFYVSAGGGNGTVAFTSKTAKVCSIDAYGIVTMLASGTCTITATQGDPTFAESVTRSLNLLLAQTITTFTPPPATDFSARSVTLQATASSSLAVQFTSTSPQVCTITASPTVTFIDSGVCQITASQPGNATYSAANPVLRDFTINAIPQTVSFNGGPLQDVKLVTTKSVALPTATGSPTGNPVTITSSTTTVCIIDSSRLNLTILSAGKCAIMASQASGAGYASASASQSFNVVTNSQTVAFTPVNDQLSTASPVILSATVSPSTSNAVVFAAPTQTGLPTVCSVRGASVIITGVGQCTLTATVPGYVDSNGNQFDNGTATQTFSVSAAPQTLVFTKPADQVYSTTTPVPLVATGAATGNTVTFASNTPKVCTTTGANATITGIGTCVISASAPAYKAAGGTGSNPQYAAGTAVASFTVTKVPQTIAFANTATSLSFTDTAVALTLTTSSTLAGGNAVGFNSTTPRVCTVSGASATLVGAGTCNLTATAPAYPAPAPDTGPQYAAGTATYAFTVTATPQLLAFNPVKQSDQVFPGTPVQLAVTGAGNGGTVTIVSTTPTVCTVNTAGPTATIVGAGKCSLTASTPAFVAAGVHYDVGTATQSFSIAQAPQTITFNSPGDQKYVAGGPVALTATSAVTVAGSRVTFSSSTPATCIASGSTATMVGGGKCTITA